MLTDHRACSNEPDTITERTLRECLTRSKQAGVSTFRCFNRIDIIGGITTLRQITNHEMERRQLEQ